VAASSSPALAAMTLSTSAMAGHRHIISGGSGNDTLNITGGDNGLGSLNVTGVERINLGVGYDYRLPFQTNLIDAGNTVTIDGSPGRVERI